MPIFDALELLPDDPIFSIPPLFAADKRSDKVDLSLGVYLDDLCRLPILQCIRRAENILHERRPDKRYQPIDGNPEYIRQTLELIFGENVLGETLYGAQTVGGTTALRLAGELLMRADKRDIYIPDSSWSNHKLIFSHAGMNVLTYPYYSADTRSFEFDKMCSAINEMPEGSTILLHSCCHNPTGIDPTYDQWVELSNCILKRKLMVLFDSAYQGFAVDLDTDVGAIRHFHAKGHEMAVAYSFSKNLGLYGERVGLLAISTPYRQTLAPIRSQVKQIIRSIYSTPPLQGGRLASTVLGSPELREQWILELKGMQKRIESIRLAFSEGLSEATSQDFSYIASQKGLFSLSGFSVSQVKHLRDQFAIYMPSNGRINLAGLNLHNLDYVIESIRSTLYP
jgi:aspartate aminotransferase